MEKDGIDACVFTSYYNLYYFSDFLYCSMGRQYAMIVTDDKAITITPCRSYTTILVLRTMYVITENGCHRALTVGSWAGRIMLCKPSTASRVCLTV